MIKKNEYFWRRVPFFIKGKEITHTVRGDFEVTQLILAQLLRSLAPTFLKIYGPPFLIFFIIHPRKFFQISK